MARRRRQCDSSLELLLDTICNTFGGILFLAILVSLLLRTSRDRAQAELQVSGPLPAMSQAERLRVESELADAAGRVEQLRKSIEVAEHLSDAFASPEIRRGMKRLDAESVRVLDLQRREAETRARLSAMQAATAESTSAIARREAELANARRLVASAEKDLSEAEQREQVLLNREAVLVEETQRRSEVKASGAAPKERATGKLEWPLLVRYGSVYQLFREDGGERIVNTDHFDVEGGFFADSAHARIGAGVDASTAGLSEALSALLRDKPPSEWYIALAVFPDSFSAFQRVKECLVGQGYEYRIIPTEGPVQQRIDLDARVQ